VTGTKSLIASPIVLLVGLALAGPARGQTSLVWKLEPGQKLLVDCRQETTTLVAFSGKSAETKLDLGVELSWTVTGRDDKAFTITQSVRRFTFKLESEKAGVIAYDSAARSQPTGQAREIAAAIKPLLAAEVAITMSERGEIVAAAPANDAAKQLFTAGPMADQPGVFSQAAIQRLLRQPLAVLPAEPVKEGDTWTTADKLTVDAGTFDQTTTYRLAGTQEQDGQQLARIEMTSELKPATPPAKGGKPALALKTHEQTGHLVFAPELGRLVSSEQNQKLVTERPYRETTITVTLASKQTLTLTAQ
jgi:hypothetical protein